MENKTNTQNNDLEKRLKNTNKILKKYIRELILSILVLFGIGLISISFDKNMGDTIRQLSFNIGLTLAPSGIITLFLSRYADSITGLTIQQTIQEEINDGFSNFEEDIKENLTKKIEACVDDNFGLVEKMMQDQRLAIEERLNNLTPSFSLLSSGTKYGVENIHLNRAQALENFNWFLDSELKKAFSNQESRIWIVSSSIKGLLTIVTDNFDGKRLFENIRDSNCKMRILMTHPEFADFRAVQEKRQKSEIPDEIKMNISILKNYGVKRESIKFYKGTPTVFGIATTDRMLLNPYPYQSEAFRCFSITVFKTINENEDIFHQYLRYHFEEPWEISESISDEYWQ
jgi:hypothetical protein